MTYMRTNNSEGEDESDDNGYKGVINSEVDGVNIEGDNCNDHKLTQNLPAH